MTIVIKPAGQDFRVQLEHEAEKVIFTFRQLDYKTKSEITGLVTRIHQGQLTIDATLQVFYNIKYGLKSVEGINDEEGKPYQVKFEDKEKRMLTDDCVDELLASVLSDNIQYTARELTAAVLPDEIKHPLTGTKLKGVEVIRGEGGVPKK